MAEETEKQEGQKTVVAFIAGLLIGGLLVWVFSSSPEDQGATATNATDENTPAETTSNETNTSDVNDSTTRTSENVTRTTSSQTTTASNDTQTNTQSESVGDGSIAVTDQGAGSMVVLTDVAYPTNAGWIVVRDYENNVPGRILGAARYNETDGLLPASVNLLRNTEAGKTYQVVFYSESGDKVFDVADDTMIQGFGATFTAE